MDANEQELAVRRELIDEWRQERTAAENREGAAGLEQPSGDFTLMEHAGAMTAAQRLQIVGRALRSNSREEMVGRMLSSSHCLFCGQSLQGTRMRAHIRTCSALLLAPRRQGAPPQEVQEIPTLTDMCLKVIKMEHAGILMGAMEQLPGAEGQLIACLSPLLIYCIVTTLFVYVQMLQQKQQAPLKKLEKLMDLLETARRDCRVFAAIAFVDRIGNSIRLVHEQTRDALRRRRHAAEKERLAARAKSRTVKAQIDALQRKMARMESRIHRLSLEKNSLKMLLEEREKGVDSMLAKEDPRHVVIAGACPLDQSRSFSSPHHTDGTSDEAKVFVCKDGKASVNSSRPCPRKPPGSIASKIPQPAQLPKEYRRKQDCQQDSKGSTSVATAPFG